jgi:hypothetical protein
MFVVAFVGYVVMGVVWFPLVESQFSLHPETFLFIAAGLGCYIVGCQVVLPDKKRLYLTVTVGIVAFYSYQEYQMAGLVIPLVGMIFLMYVERMKAEYLLVIGIFLLAGELLVKGVPLFDSELRKGYVDAVFIFGYSFLFLGLTFMTRHWDTHYIVLLFAGSLVLLSLFTYRVYVIELVIVVVVSLYMLKKVKLLHVAASGIPLFLLVLLLGYIGVSYQSWKLNVIELFFYRPAFTLGVLSRIVHEAGYSGIAHGGLWLHIQSTVVIGPYLFGYESNITSTIMGPLIFDGGIVELGLMAFFGAGVHTLYRKALADESRVPYYAVLMAMVLVGVDVSFIPSIVILFFAGLYLVSEAGT